ncbi:MAG: hypothetical protein Q9201_004784 [Fulgogasparrea decipioides]
MVTKMLQVSFVLVLFYTVSTLAQQVAPIIPTKPNHLPSCNRGANHANVHRGWHLGQGPYFCGTDADGDGPELLAAVMNPQCGATIWVKNTGTFGSSVNNGIGNCIQAKLVDQEGGGSVDLNPAGWTALTNSPDGQVAVEWYARIHRVKVASGDDADCQRGYGSCPGGGGSPAPVPDTSTSPSSNNQQGDPSNDNAGGGCTVQANEQCGGQAFTGCTTCADGMQCTFFNDFVYCATASAIPQADVVDVKLTNDQSTNQIEITNDEGVFQPLTKYDNEYSTIAVQANNLRGVSSRT